MKPDDLRKLADDLEEKTKLADDLEEKTSDRYLIVLDRGWIFVGNLFQTEDGNFVLSNAKNIRRWEKNGFGALSKAAKKAQATLDDCADIHFAPSAKIFCIPISEDWDA